jgi:tRNA threonylcarbamoyladenosine biosynthesis protein TsaB
MRVLALDTSGQHGTAALVDEARLLAEVTFHAGHAQAERMFPALDALFALSGLEKDAIELLAVGLGPGGFTSVRVGLATVKGLSLARDVPVVGVSSLLALARGLSPAGGLAAAFVDAGRSEVYAALYDLDAGAALLDPALGEPGALAARVEEAAAGRAYVCGGDGMAKYGDAIARGARGGRAADASFWSVRASALAYEARRMHARDGASDVDTLEPLYVRPSDAALPKTPLRDPGTVL